MMGSDEDHGKSRRPNVEDWRWSYRSDTQCQTIMRSGDAVCGLHRARGDKERGFLG
jgi:hypothetical protein